MVKHLDMTELLALRDREGSVAARQHVAECSHCAAQLERLHQRVAALKALPEFQPARDRWPAIRETVLAERRQARRWLGVSGLAAAAVLTLVIGFSEFSNVVPSLESQPGVSALIEESQRLEDVLRDVGQPGRVMNGITAAAIADLEDRIALIDAGISEARAQQLTERDIRPLWEQRVNLMGALVNTHVRQVGYVGF